MPAKSKITGGSAKLQLNMQTLILQLNSNDDVKFNTTSATLHRSKGYQLKKERNWRPSGILKGAVEKSTK